MTPITNIQEATEYVYSQLKEINPTIEKDDVYDSIIDEVLESTEYKLDDEDLRFLENNYKNTQSIDTYLQTKIPEYEELLSYITLDMISDEII